MKNLTLLIFSLMIGTYCQGQDYILYKGGPSLTLPDRGETCTEDFRTNGRTPQYSYGKKYFYYFVNETPYHNYYSIPTSNAGYIQINLRNDQYYTFWTSVKRECEDLVAGQDPLRFLRVNVESNISARVIDFKFTQPQISLCHNHGSIDLRNYISYREGTTFSGNGVSGYYFHPMEAGVSDENGWSITASNSTFDNANDLPVYTSFKIRVTPTYIDQAAGNSPDMWQVEEINACSDDEVIDLRTLVSQEATQPGNGFVWEGGAGNLFSPSIGEGTHTITYTYTNGYNCTTTHTIEAKVTDAFNLSSEPVIEKCINDASFELSASRSGGAWTYPDKPDAITNTLGSTYKFSPATAGAGNHTVYYTHSEGFCTKQTSTTISVYELPAVEAGSNLEFCNNTEPLQNLNTSAVAPFDQYTSWSQISPNVIGALDDAEGIIDISKLSPGVDYTVIREKTNAKGCYNFDTRIVRINSTLSPPEIQEGAFVCEEGAVNMQIFAPQDGVLYKWYDSESATTQIFSGTAYQTGYLTDSKNFWISAKNSFGCESEKAMVTAEVRSNPVINFSPEDKIQYTCYEGDVIDLSGDEGFPQHTWSGSGVNSVNGTFDPTGLPYGSYAITLRATVNGCTAYGNKQAIIRTPSVVEAGFLRQACFGDGKFVMNNDATVIPSDGTWKFVNSAYAFALKNDTVDLTGLQPSIEEGYLLEYAITDTFGCKSSDIVKLQIYPDPGNPITSSIEQCGPGRNTFQVSNQDNGEIYKWYTDTEERAVYTGRQFQTPVLQNDTVFYVQASDNKGCTSEFIQVNATVHPLPEVEVVTNTVLCLNTINFNMYELTSLPGGRFYERLPNNENGILTSNQFFPNIVGEGSYGFEYELESDKGCTNRAPFQITVTGSVSDNILIADDTTLCESEGPIYLQDWALIKGGTFTGGIAVEGNFFTPQLATSAILPISYSLDQEGCLFQDEITVTLLGAPENPEIIGNPEGCQGRILEFATENISNMSYNWYLDHEETVFSNSQNINVVVGEVEHVELEVKNIQGCPSAERASLDIVNNTPVGSITISDSYVEKGSLVQLELNTEDEIASHSWNFGDGFKSVAASPKHYFYILDTFDVSVLFISEKGCAGHDTLENAIVVWGQETSFPTADQDFAGEKKNKVTAYPTLVKGSTNFKWLEGSPGTYEVIVYDMLGQTRLAKTIENDIINLSDLTPGKYFLSVISGNEITVLPIIKQ